MGIARTVAAIAVGGLVSGLLSGIPATATGADTAAAPATTSRPGDVVEAPATRDAARSVRDYWTPERMRSAVPRDLDADGSVIDRSGNGTRPDADRGTERRRLKVPRSTGKLFFTVPGQGPAVCSAAAIRTKRRNQVITAGHCVHSGPTANPTFFSNFVYVPRYRNGRAPMGRWVGRRVWTFRGWTEREAFRFDQAIIAFRKRNGRKLVRVTGGNKIVCCKARRHRKVRIWGWPAQGPRYNGEVARQCTGRTARFRRTGDARMRHCPMTGGASGGPWLLKKKRKVNRGIIWAVTSRRLTNRPVLLAHPLPRAIRGLRRAANR